MFWLGNEREEKVTSVPQSPLRACPLKPSHWAPFLEVFTVSQYHHSSGKPVTHGPLGDIREGCLTLALF
jgi:hypothetical protein